MYHFELAQIVLFWKVGEIFKSLGIREDTFRKFEKILLGFFSSLSIVDPRFIGAWVYLIGSMVITLVSPLVSPAVCPSCHISDCSLVFWDPGSSKGVLCNHPCPSVSPSFTEFSSMQNFHQCRFISPFPLFNHCPLPQISQSFSQFIHL